MKSSRTNAVKNVIIILITCLAVTVVALASTSMKGNETKGKFYYKQTCKQCHIKGGPGGELTPLTKTQAQWKSVFTKGKHPKDNQALLQIQGMDEEKLTDIYTFLYNHAADSPQPETCGK
jgi:cytochrome c5